MIRLYFTTTSGERPRKGRDDDSVLSYENRKGIIVPVLKKKVEVYNSRRTVRTVANAIAYDNVFTPLPLSTVADWAYW